MAALKCKQQNRYQRQSNSKATDCKRCGLISELCRDIDLIMDFNKEVIEMNQKIDQRLRSMVENIQEVEIELWEQESKEHIKYEMVSMIFLPCFRFDDRKYFMLSYHLHIKICIYISGFWKRDDF